MSENKKAEPKTISVPTAGKRYYGLERNGSYEAAKRGDIPTIKVGRLLRVPVAAMERKLEQVGNWQQLGDAAQQACADIRDTQRRMQAELNKRRE